MEKDVRDSSDSFIDKPENNKKNKKREDEDDEGENDNDEFKRIRSDLLEKSTTRQDSIQKFKNNLNWFDIETKIRSIVVEVTDPFIDAFTNLKESNFQLKTANEQSKIKLEEQNLALYKINKKMQTIDEIQQKFKQQTEFHLAAEEKLELKQRKYEAESIYMKDQIAKLNDAAIKQIANVDDLEDKIKESYLKIEQQKVIIDGQIIEAKRNIYTSIDNIKVNINENYSELKEIKYSIDNIKDIFK